MPSEVTDLTKDFKTGLLEGEGVAAIARAAATTTAMSHFTDTARASPSALLKAAEWYSYAWNLCWPVAAYRKLRYGTIDTGSFDMLEITSDMKAAAQLRDQLYEQMCNNFFRFAAAGLGSAKRYLDGLVTQTAGQHTALMQFFYAVNLANTAVQDAIDRFRRRVYAIRVTSEVAMVVLGAGPIALGVQIGVGLGYSLITKVVSMGRCNTIWYNAVFKGGVYDPRETVWAFSGAEARPVASLEGGTVVA